MLERKMDNSWKVSRQILGGVFDEEVFYDLYNAQSLNRTMAIDYCRELAYSGENVYLYIMEIHKRKN